MNLQSLQDLQTRLLTSDYRSGIFLDALFKEALWDKPEINEDPQQYMKTLGETFVLANYIQRAYQERLAISSYPKQDDAFRKFLSNVQGNLYGLADEFMATYPDQQGDLQLMIDSPEDYYSQVDSCKQVESALDSLYRFRLTYQTPFDQPDPENIRHLYHLYQDVASIDRTTLSEVEQREKVQWLDWATDSFTPLSDNDQLRRVSQKHIEALDRKVVAFLQLTMEMKPSEELPKDIHTSLETCEQAVQTLASNIHRHFKQKTSYGKHLPARMPDQQLMKKEIAWLQEPTQPTIFSAVTPAKPSPTDWKQGSTISRPTRELEMDQ